MTVSEQSQSGKDMPISDNAEALAGVAFAAIAADREIKDIEMMHLQAVFSRTRLFAGWTVEQYTALFKKLRAYLDDQGWENGAEISMPEWPEVRRLELAGEIDGKAARRSLRMVLEPELLILFEADDADRQARDLIEGSFASLKHR